MLVETDLKTFVDLLTKFNSLLSQFQKIIQKFGEQNEQPLEIRVASFLQIKTLKTDLDVISKQIQTLQKTLSSYFDNKNVTQYSNKFYSDSESDTDDDDISIPSSSDANAKRQYERLTYQYKNLNQSFSMLSQEYTKLSRLMSPYLKKDSSKEFTDLTSSNNNNSSHYTPAQTIDVDNPYLRIQSQVFDDKFVPIDSLVMEERNQDIQNLATDLLALKDLTIEMAQHVHTQGERINVAEENVNQAVEDTNTSVTELYKAAQSQSKAYAKKGAAIGTAVGGVIGSVGILLGPVGAAVGIGTGATTGGALGYKMGQKIGNLKKNSADKVYFKHKMDQVWVPDHEASHCGMCKKKFNVKRRKHHCRLCGNIFCSKCCKNKVNYKFEDVDSEMEIRVCNTCIMLIA